MQGSTQNERELDVLQNQRNIRKSSNLTEGLLSIRSNHSHFNHHHHPGSQTISTLIKITLICTLFMIIELIGGYLSDSVAVMSDALHLTVDIIGYAIQIFSAWLAQRKHTKRFNYGYLRAEPVGAIINSLTIWILTVYLVTKAIHRLIHPDYEIDPKIMLVTSVFGVFANLMMAVVLHGCKILKYFFMYPCLSAEQKDQIMISDGNENLNIRAVMVHISGDLVYSVGVLIAAITININPAWKFMDSICTLLFSLIVLEITVPVFKDSILSLMEGVPLDIDRDTLAKSILALDDIEEINSLRVWSVTTNNNCGNLHASIRGEADEQILHKNIGKIFKDTGIEYWTIQLSKSRVGVAFKDYQA